MDGTVEVIFLIPNGRGGNKVVSGMTCTPANVRNDQIALADIFITRLKLASQQAQDEAEAQRKAGPVGRLP